MKQPTIEECVEIAQERIEDAQYWMSKAESPIIKRNHRKEINFWSTIIQHLQELKSLKSSNSQIQEQWKQNQSQK